jgi:hypothetical protein
MHIGKAISPLALFDGISAKEAAPRLGNVQFGCDGFDFVSRFVKAVVVDFEVKAFGGCSVCFVHISHVRPHKWRLICLPKLTPMSKGKKTKG